MHIIFARICVLASFVVLVSCNTNYEEYLATLRTDMEQWWGSEENESKASSKIEPFKIEFTDKMVSDLKYRINNRRDVTPPLEGVGFEYGFNTKVLDTWMDYWANNYSFSERENYLNKYPQYKIQVQGLGIHFIWIKPEVSSDLEVVPLLMLHGWPGSCREFYDAIPLITATSANRNFVVHAVVPSLPGFGFSDGATRPGFGQTEIAALFRNFMHALGYKKFYIQAGDFGALIANNIVTLYQKEVLGYHMNFALSLSAASLGTWFTGSLSDSLQNLVVDASLADRLYPMASTLKFLISETGYLHLQATKPDTLGVMMSDSPTGLLAYILQSISLGSRREYVSRVDGGLFNIFSRDAILDNLMYYWTGNKFTTAVRIYSESMNIRTISLGVAEIPTSVPTRTMHAKYELVYQSPTMLRSKYTNLLNSTVYDDYGHFMAWEKPDIYVQDVLESLVDFRAWHSKNNQRCSDEL